MGTAYATGFDARHGPGSVDNFQAPPYATDRKPGMNPRQRLVAVRNALVNSVRAFTYLRLCFKYRNFTMAPAISFWRNLLIANSWRHVPGCIVECGVWRGGASAGMAEVLGADRDYFLFDSFEGLPPAQDLDGPAAKAWQEDTRSEAYYDNCSAPIEFAERAMRLSGVPRYRITKGWFDRTLPGFVPPSPIAILRLDGDWYESTMTSLESLHKYLAPGGIVVVDDYYAWDGCSRAIHDFLSRTQSTARITQVHGICVIQQR